MKCKYKHILPMLVVGLILFSIFSEPVLAGGNIIVENVRGNCDFIYAKIGGNHILLERLGGHCPRVGTRLSGNIGGSDPFILIDMQTGKEILVRVARYN